MNHPSNPTSFNPAIPTEMKTVAQVVLNGLQSPKSKRIYKMALRDFLNYWVENGSPLPDKLFLQTYVFHMLETGVGKASINIRLAAIKNFSREATDMNVWPF